RSPRYRPRWRVRAVGVVRLGAGERRIEDADQVDVGERFDVVSVLRPNHIEGLRPQRVHCPGSPIGDLERAIEYQIPLPVVLVPAVTLAALPDAHRMEGEAETVGDG